MSKIIIDNRTILKDTVALDLVKTVINSGRVNYPPTFRWVGFTLRHIKRTRCKQEFGMNDHTQSVLPLDNELKELHSIL